MKIINSITVSCLLFASIAHSYEVATHGAITAKAHDRSVIYDGSLLSDFGVTENTSPFGSQYYVFEGNWVRPAGAGETENTVILNDLKSLGIQPLSIPGWLMRGSILEDDLFPTVRVLRHFFDPIENKGLLGIYERAPKWGLGSSEPFQIPAQEETPRENRSTLFDALETMYRALTGHSSNGSPNIAPYGLTASNAEDQEEIRNAYWATTFLTLGDVIHLIQDMGQPQHTRDDAHSGKGWQSLQESLTGHTSVYEKYTDARATLARFTFNDEIRNVPVAALDYGNYPFPEFNDYISFFSTRHQGDIMQRRGLADYSNRGFYSAGTNIGQNTYPFPDDDDVTPYPSYENWFGQPLQDGGSVALLVGDVTDSLVPGQEVASLSTYGLFDQFLQVAGEDPHYNLTKKNYDDMARLLIPRAVSYSAGFLNYFFRGRLAIDELLEDEQDGIPVIRLTVKNKSTTGTQNHTLHDGKFEVYYDDRDGYRRKANFAAINPGDQVSQSIPFDGTHVLTIETPSDAASQYMLVYTGKIGSANSSVDEVGIAAREFSTAILYILDGDTRYAYGINPRTGDIIDVRDVRAGSYTGDIAIYGDYTFYNTGSSSGWYTRIRNEATGFQNRITYGDDLAVNSTNLFTADWVGGSDGGVSVYTHDGTYLTTFLTSPNAFAYYNNFKAAVNNSYLVVQDAITMRIFNLSGMTEVAQVSPIVPGQEALPNEAGVEVTNDRIFVENGQSTQMPVNEPWPYDGNILAFNFDGSINQIIPNVGMYVTCMAITQDHLYVVYSEWYGMGEGLPSPNNFVRVYKREVYQSPSGEVGPDTYTQIRDIDLNSQIGWAAKCSLDRKYFD